VIVIAIPLVIAIIALVTVIVVRENVVKC